MVPVSNATKNGIFPLFRDHKIWHCKRRKTYSLAVFQMNTISNMEGSKMTILIFKSALLLIQPSFVQHMSSRITTLNMVSYMFSPFCSFDLDTYILSNSSVVSVADTSSWPFPNELAPYHVRTSIENFTLKWPTYAINGLGNFFFFQLNPL